MQKKQLEIHNDNFQFVIENFDMELFETSKMLFNQISKEINKNEIAKLSLTQTAIEFNRQKGIILAIHQFIIKG